MTGIRILHSWVIVVALAASVVVGLEGQALYGSLVGNVADETGAVVPGATVAVTHKETNQTREQPTSVSGALFICQPRARHL